MKIDAAKIKFKKVKKHDSQRRDRISRIFHFLGFEIGQISPDFGAISLLDYTEKLELGFPNSKIAIAAISNCSKISAKLQPESPLHLLKQANFIHPSPHP